MIHLEKIRRFGAVSSASLLSSILVVKSEGKAAKSSSTTESSTNLFYGECLERQICHPLVPYPAWNYAWDLREPIQSGENQHRLKTRHIILIRHGQYEQDPAEDHQRVLTELGRRQAEYTGKRLAEMLSGPNLRYMVAGQDVDECAGPIRIKAIHTSGMKRAQETASIIAAQLEPLQKSITLTEPDVMLNEALPSPIIPMRHDVGTIEEIAKEVDENHDRIELAFRKFFHRDDGKDDNQSNESDSHRHEFELIVCHANIIRYFLLRALQLPPEAWLRFSLFNCSITYLTIQPDGRVTVRLVGDTGHIPYHETTFGSSFGYNWKTPTVKK
jgi:serine/threonine-protein phosphatase PGAM5